MVMAEFASRALPGVLEVLANDGELRGRLRVQARSDATRALLIYSNLRLHLTSTEDST